MYFRLYVFKKILPAVYNLLLFANLSSLYFLLNHTDSHYLFLYPSTDSHSNHLLVEISFLWIPITEYKSPLFPLLLHSYYDQGLICLSHVLNGKNKIK